MTKDELYDKLIAMLPVENKDDKEFRVLLSDSFRTYQSYLDDTPELSDDIKNEAGYVCEVLKEIVKAQYKGLHSQAFNKLSNLLSGKSDHKGLSHVLPVSLLGAHSSFFRGRTQSGNEKFTYKDMFHIPFDKRGIIKTQRYSFPGYPCLYVGATSYACWEELHRVDYDLCMFSRIETQKNIAVLNMQIPSKAKYDEDIKAVLYLMPLLIASMVIVKNLDDVFKPEYIVPQLLTEWLISHNDKKETKKNGDIIYGISYTSSLKTEEFEFPSWTLNNFALFPIQALTNKKYCPKLSEIFHITSPTCNEYEKLKCGYTIDAGHVGYASREEELEANYRASDFFCLEKRLMDPVKFPLHEMA